MQRIITLEMINQYELELYEEEKSKATIQKYLRDLRRFFMYLPELKEVNKKAVIQYKQYLKEHYKATSANSMLVALNRFLMFAGWADCRVRQFRVQKMLFCKEERTLSAEEYKRLVQAADSRGNSQLCLVLQTICSTGIRVGELRYITVESLREGMAEIDNKGKDRRIIFTKELSRLLIDYCFRNRIVSGPVFVTKNGGPLDRSNVWRAMKGLCGDAGVDPRKVFPHNLRHLFAFTFYSQEKDVVRLAEILGHSSIETTRIYTTTTGEEHKRMLSRLKLIFGVEYKNDHII